MLFLHIFFYKNTSLRNKEDLNIHLVCQTLLNELKVTVDILFVWPRDQQLSAD